MRAIGSLLIACVALAIIRAVVATLLLVLIIAMIWAFCRHPRETFGLLLYCTIAGLISRYPIACLIILVAAIIVAPMRQESG